MNVKESLKRLRIRTGFNKAGMAHSAGMGARTWSDWESDPPDQLIWLVNLANRHEVSADYILGLTDDPSPKPKIKLSIDEHSIVKIMGELPEHKKEEVIRIAEVVLDMYRKQELEESAPSLYDKIEGQYGKNDNTPHIIGEDVGGENDQSLPPQNRKG